VRGMSLDSESSEPQALRPQASARAASSMALRGSIAGCLISRPGPCAGRSAGSR
jgi:hypothetical protein